MSIDFTWVTLRFKWMLLRCSFPSCIWFPYNNGPRVVDMGRGAGGGALLKHKQGLRLPGKSFRTNFDILRAETSGLSILLE